MQILQEIIPSNPYAHTFNGMEKDDEIKGAGNSLDFGARVYDPRLGRWLSIDPLTSKYPSHSPFSLATNNPIVNIDDDGRDVIVSPALSANNQLGKMQGVLSKTRAYKKLVKRFNDNNNTLNLAIGYDSQNSGSGAVADTYYFTNGGVYKSAFDGNDFHGVRFFTLDVKLGQTGEVIGQKTFDQTVLAGVLTHELIHANLDSYLEKENVDFNAVEKQYKGINQYIDDYGFTEQAQHEYMAANSRDDIAKAMKQFDRKSGNKVKSKEWYNAVSWYGLRANNVNGEIVETKAWKEFKETATEEQIQYIEDVLSSEEVTGKLEMNSNDSE